MALASRIAYAKPVMKKTLAPFALLAAFVVSSAACSSSTPGGGGPTTGPQQACLDAADIFSKAAVRCGQDYNTNHQAFIDSVAKGDCKNIVGVRDEGSFRNTCFPSVNVISCADLTAGNIDATCKAQLLRAASFQPILAPGAVDVSPVSHVGAVADE